MKCVVCNSIISENGSCDNCGFDPSCNYEAYPTLAFLTADTAKTVAVLKLEYEAEHSDEMKCPDCGGFNFRCKTDASQLICVNCGHRIKLNPHTGQAQNKPEARRTIISSSINEPKPDHTTKTVRSSATELIIRPYNSIRQIAAVRGFIAIINDDGTVDAVGDSSYANTIKAISKWTRISSLAVADKHTVGLDKNGRVFAAGENGLGQCAVTYWHGITAVAANWNRTFGLKTNGTIVSTRIGDACEKWESVKQISAGRSHLAALLNNGKVITNGNNLYGQCNVETWRDIVAIACGRQHTVGITNEKKVLAVGLNDNGQCNVSAWSDIMAVAAGLDFTAGLKKDGTVVIAGNSGLTKIAEGWKSISSVIAGDTCLVATSKNGHSFIAGSIPLHKSFTKLLQKSLTKLFGEKFFIGTVSDGQVARLVSDNSSVSTNKSSAETRGGVSKKAVELIPGPYKSSAETRGGVSKKTVEPIHGPFFAENEQGIIAINENGSCVIAETYFDAPALRVWSDRIVAVAAGQDHFAVLKEDGHIATYKRAGGIIDWQGSFISVSAYANLTFGITKKGRVRIEGTYNQRVMDEIRNWSNIRSVSAGYGRFYGLKQDGTVAAADKALYDCLKVERWTLIKKVAVGETHTVGLRKDGTVIAIGDNSKGQCDTSDWRNIVSVAAGSGYTVGVQRDGKVLFAGKERFDLRRMVPLGNYIDPRQCTDIVDVCIVKSNDRERILCLKKDGTIVRCGLPDAALDKAIAKLSKVRVK